MRTFMAFVLIAVVIGCGPTSHKVAEVSGTVKMDGKPLTGASITFVPIASKGNENPGPTAQGKTNAEGRYKLDVDPSTPGAVVGKCRVYITTLISEPTADDRDAGGVVKIKDKVPEKYNMKTELTFDVPPGGTKSADFDLKSR